MIAVIALGLLAMLACLALQVLASVFAARYFAQASKQPLGPKPLRGKAPKALGQNGHLAYSSENSGKFGSKRSKCVASITRNDIDTVLERTASAQVIMIEK